MPSGTAYRGRFAPSPTGPLHFGSLAAAVASFLDARHHRGTWLVRIDDLDQPRCVPGAADDILRTLESYGLHWDGEILYQDSRAAAYEAALHKLQGAGAVYPCACTRREIADSAVNGIDGQVYPGTCRKGISPGRLGRAWRVRTDHVYAPGWETWDGTIGFEDALQGHISQHLAGEIGDFVVKRADGLFSYQLAVVVDDAHQGITHVVRGADLLASTPRQIFLQRLLGISTPLYMHFPVAVNDSGEKLSKQTLAQPVKRGDAEALLRVLSFLRQHPPAGLRGETAEHVLQ
ncbi:MAG TPA: tRNA glutamyl-Q(34) synthetase GluQRS, partial [Gallionellaceae bacterium]